MTGSIFCGASPCRIRMDYKPSPNFSSGYRRTPSVIPDGQASREETDPGGMMLSLVSGSPLVIFARLVPLSCSSQTGIREQHHSSSCQLLYTLRRTKYVIDTRRSRCGDVGKQERQAITIKNSKMRVVIRRNLCRKGSQIIKKG